ncbi:1436_t:CDS:2, partial [Funneliformis mosseae]
VRRLIVAMSRARLGLYVFCRRSIFENRYELGPTFNELLERSDKLQLKINENVAPQIESDVYAIADVTHIGKYVYQMMQEQLAFAKEQKAKMETAEAEETV